MSEVLTELEALVALTFIPTLGSVKIQLLIQQFGSARDAWEASPEALHGLPGFSPKLISNWESYKKDPSWKQQLELAYRQKVDLISYRCPTYPKRLLEIPDYPVVLYVSGTLLPQDAKCLAIVGTRNSTLYGNECATSFAAALAEMRFTIVSGLARGIDTAAHQGAMTKGRTIAVLGSGLAQIYPRENQRLAEKIGAEGAVITEFPMLTPPERHNFPQRNRIVSGMSLGTFLVEAPLKSGAMLTMERAWNQKRALFALPGRVDNENFQGNHAWIKSGKAQLVTTPRDIAVHFETLFPLTSTAAPSRQILLEPEESDLMKHFSREEISYDHLISKTHLPAQKLNVLLMSLILKKAIKEFPGKLYKAI